MWNFHKSNPSSSIILSQIWIIEIAMEGELLSTILSNSWPVWPLNQSPCRRGPTFWQTPTFGLRMEDENTSEEALISAYPLYIPGLGVLPRSTPQKLPSESNQFVYLESLSNTVSTWGFDSKMLSFQNTLKALKKSLLPHVILILVSAFQDDVCSSTIWLTPLKRAPCLLS